MHGTTVKNSTHVMASKYEHVYTKLGTLLKLADKQNPYAQVSTRYVVCVSKCYTAAILTHTCKVILPEPDK